MEDFRLSTEDRRQLVKSSLEESHYAVCVCAEANASAPLCNCDRRSNPSSSGPLYIPKDLVSALAKGESLARLQGDSLEVAEVLPSATVASPASSASSSRRPSVDAAFLRDRATSNRKLDPVLTAEEVARHNTAEDCWMIIEDRVYDVTEYLGHHPGGTRAILKFAGRDGTENVQFHSPRMMKLLRTYFYVGRLKCERKGGGCVIC